MKLFLALAVVLASTLAEFNSSGALVPELLNEGRVLNGIHAIPGQFPYQVGIKGLQTDLVIFHCGGSLIGEKWVLTAAHCLTDVKELKLYLATLVLAKSKKVVSTKAHRIFVHPKYSPMQKGNDIGLIKIPAVKLSKRIKIVRLPSIASTDSLYENEVAVLSGWGMHQEDASRNLKWGELIVISNQKCRQFYADEISNSRMCAESAAGAHMCEGDSGGPLVLLSTRTLIGVASQLAGFDCRIGPSVYTRVTSHLEWIKSITGIFY